MALSILFKRIFFFIICSLLFCAGISAQDGVGINTITPSEKLDIEGNLKYSGALMPNNNPGDSGDILVSGGANSSSGWGPKLIDATTVQGFGKYFVNGIGLPRNSSISVTVTDPNCTINSVCTTSYYQLDRALGGGPPGIPNFEKIRLTIEAQSGQWVFNFDNQSGQNVIAGISFIAFYY
jgi:hypothetical protein